MLAFIKRKLSESDSGATTNQNNSSSCDENSEQNNNNSGISSVIDTLVRKASHMTMSTTRSSSNVEQIIPIGQDALLEELGYKNVNDFRETIYDLLRSIRDPEKPATLEDLDVVYEEGIFILTPTKSNVHVVRIEFNPTVPHCSLATLIGLCVRIKVERSLPHLVKLDIYIKKGAHNTEDEINKQINDKERVAAAMENPNLRNLVENCIKDED